MSESNSIPRCVGVIIDGNRRWARERGIPTLEGHRRGIENVAECVRWAKEAGVQHLIFYTFSTENWKRSEEEKEYLFMLSRNMFAESMQELSKEGVRVRTIGQRHRFPEDMQKEMARVEEMSKENTTITATFALSYGGRAEITDTINRLLASGATSATEEAVSKALWTADIPDPDILIRTGGEKRLSNFLPWQGVYAELFFVEQYWPDFAKEDFIAILEEYGNRERRKGK